MVAVVHLLCQANPSFATAVVNGLLAAATALGGCVAFGSGALAAISLFPPAKPWRRTNAISMGMGWGFMLGMVAGPLTLFVFVDRLVS
jgi:MFS family permease